MKVIAKISCDRYVCEVSHEELEQFLNKYYGYLSKLEVGDEVDLGKGYDFRRDCLDALSKTQAFINANKKAIETILNGITFLGTNVGKREEDE